tara:strand:- start:408 stop:593 length:186 start_codon:yes stop_codon:yes gene_type:complete
MTNSITVESKERLNSVLAEASKLADRINLDRFYGELSASEDTIRLTELLEIMEIILVRNAA